MDRSDKLAHFMDLMGKEPLSVHKLLEQYYAEKPRPILYQRSDEDMNNDWRERNERYLRKAREFDKDRLQEAELHARLRDYLQHAGTQPIAPPQPTTAVTTPTNDEEIARLKGLLNTVKPVEENE